MRFLINITTSNNTYGIRERIKNYLVDEVHSENFANVTLLEIELTQTGFSRVQFY